MNRNEMQLTREPNVRFGQLKRKYRRMDITGFDCDIADGSSSYGGKVEDISSGGFKITNIPQSFSADRYVYTVLLSSQDGKHFRLLARPCWSKRNSGADRLEMGFRIIDAPWEWTEFTFGEISDVDYEDDYVFH